MGREETPMFMLSPLPYDVSALEPHITTRAMETHYNKHHQAYITNLNRLVNGTEYQNMNLNDVIRRCANNPKLSAIFNNAAQAWNHEFYWNSMNANGGGAPKGPLLDQIKEDFGSFDMCKKQLQDAAITHFGSGWAWLVVDTESNKLMVTATSNADSPFIHHQHPLLTLDVWEHAYYLDYQDMRSQYVNVFLNNLINWDFASYNYEAYLNEHTPSPSPSPSSLPQ